MWRRQWAGSAVGACGVPVLVRRDGRRWKVAARPQMHMMGSAGAFQAVQHGQSRDRPVY